MHRKIAVCLRSYIFRLTLSDFGAWAFHFCSVLPPYSAPEFTWSSLESAHLGHLPISWKHSWTIFWLILLPAECKNKLAVSRWNSWKTSCSKTRNTTIQALHSSHSSQRTLEFHVQLVYQSLPREWSRCWRTGRYI